MTTAVEPRAARRIRPDTYLFFFVLFALALFAGHAFLLDTPFYGDEMGQFVPAARDLWRDGAWVPHAAPSTAQPPALAAYLAAVWRVAGDSIPATRIAMLALASLAALFAFLLAIELARGAPGAPAFAAAAFLLAAPLFFAQSTMALPDVPAMLCAAVALLCFFQERLLAAALVSVIVRETGLLGPAVLGGWRAYERRWRDAALFLIPAAPLAAWLIVLRGSGTPVANPLDLVHAPVRVLRLLYYLLVADFHWIGTAALSSPGAAPDSSRAVPGKPPGGWWRRMS